MAVPDKHDKIIDALQQLLKEKELEYISVSEIAKTAGMGKGSIYYYFPSKDAILNALIERSYRQPLQTAKKLAAQAEVDPFARMAILFGACRNASASFLMESRDYDTSSLQQQAFLYHKYARYLITELKPTLSEIIRQGIDKGIIQFDYPEALAEIVLIVLVVKLENFLMPASTEEIELTIRGLISLLEKGTGIPPGTLEYLSAGS